MLRLDVRKLGGLCGKSTQLIVESYTDIEQIDCQFIQRWRDLEENALVANAYLSPDFVLPAIKHLTPGLALYFISVDILQSGHRRMIAIGIFERVSRCSKYPFPYLKAYSSKHSFLSGILLCDRQYRLGYKRLLDEIKAKKKWGLIEFQNTHWAASVEKNGLSGNSHSPVHWVEMSSFRRPVISPRSTGEEFIKRTFSKKRQKQIAQKLRQLHRLGNLKWELIESKDLTKRHIHSFIKLENDGWKGSLNSSIASCPKEILFFQEMNANFIKHNKAFFTEFSLNGEVIASTCNYLSGKEGFAFKLGWQTHYAKYSLGYLNEYKIVRNIHLYLPDLKMLDSGTDPDSFMEKLWREERKISTGVITLTHFSWFYIFCWKTFRTIYRAIHKRSIVKLVHSFINLR